MNLQDFATLAEAKLYTQQVERELPLVTLIKGLVQTSSITSLETSIDPRAKGFLLMVTSGVPLFDFRNSSSEGQQYQSVLSALVSIGAVTQGFYNGVIAYCNYDVKPFENSTDYEFAREKGTINLLPKTPAGGYVKLTSNTSDKFLAVFYTEVQGVRVRAGSITIEGAGDYIIKTNQPILIENFYDSLV